MKTIILTVLGIVIAGTLGLVLYQKNTPTQTNSEELAKAWIEIITPKAFAVDENGNEIREFKTGDEISKNTTIKTSDGSFVNLYLPDGSVARIDAGSTITINEALYQKTDGKLIVSIFIKTGRVWSKILGLTTPDSLWEVKTTNAVATVRGTAFGMEYKNGKSRVIGSENKVAVAPVDPKTQKVVESASVLVEPDTFVSFGNEDVEKIIKEKKALRAEPMREEILKEKWIERSKNDDGKIEEKFEEFRKNIKNEEEVKSEFREFIQEKFMDKILEQREEDLLKEDLNSENDLNSLEKDLESFEKELQENIETKEEQPAENRESIRQTTEPTEEPIRREINRTLTPKDLKIIIKTPAGELTEGIKIPIEAIVSFSDGSTRPVSGEVKLEVIGGIGRIENGVFVPSLDASIAEFGKGVGSIVAIWRDPQTSTELVANTPILTVNAAVDQIINTLGQ